MYIHLKASCRLEGIMCALESKIREQVFEQVQKALAG